MGASGNRTPPKISLYLLFVKDQVIEIVLLRCALEQEGIARFEEWAWARLGVSQILLLKFRKALRLQYGYFAFMLHVRPP